MSATQLAVDSLPIAWQRVILDLFALAGETVKGGASEVKERVLRQPGSTRYQAVAVNFAPVKVGEDVALQANARIVIEGRSRVVRVRLFNPFGIEIKRGHPLTQSGVPGLLMSPAPWDRKGQYWKLIPFGYANPDLLAQLNKLLEREGQSQIPVIPHGLRTTGSIVFAFTPTHGEDRKGKYYIGSCLGTQLFLDHASGNIPLSGKGQFVETALAVSKFMEGRAFVTVLGPAKDVDMRRFEVVLDVEDRASISPFELIGMDIEKIDPDPHSKSPWTVRQVIARLITNPGDERLMGVILSSGLIVQGDPIPVRQQMAVSLLRQAEPALQEEVRLRWDKITDPTVPWTGINFPTQADALQGRERRDWYRQIREGDLVAPIVAWRMSLIFGAEITFDPKNPWHRVLRAWIFKNKCEKTEGVPEEPAVTEEVRPDEAPAEVPKAEQIAESEAPPEVPEDEE